MIALDVWLATEAVATVMAMSSIVCRAAKMSRDTPAVVRMQHGALFAGLAFSMVLPGVAGKACLVLGALAWLTLGAPRWRHGAPPEMSAASRRLQQGMTDR